jgi:hypothetical protein
MYDQISEDDVRGLANCPILAILVHLRYVTYILNGQGLKVLPVKCTAFKKKKMGANSRRNERGYDSEKLIGRSEEKDTRNIQTWQLHGEKKG